MPQATRFERPPKNSALKYLFVALLYCALTLLITLMKPAQIPRIEEGTFREDNSGATLTVRNGVITYGKFEAPYELFIGKGERFLSTKSILGDLYGLDINGRKVPSEIIIENIKGAASACSIRSGGDEVCFRRVA